MAFYDWNRDGKKDWKDNYIEYNINKRSKNSHKSTNLSYGGGGSTIGAIFGAILLLAFVAIIINSCTPKCIISDCDSPRESKSSYCYYHKNSEVYRINSGSSGASRNSSTSSNNYSSNSTYSEYSKQCSYTGCTNKKGKGSYCYSHTCFNKGCTKKQLENKCYCAEHQAAMVTTSQYKTIGAKDYDNPDDYASDFAEDYAYDEFGDDDSAYAYDYGYEEAYNHWMDEMGE